jgi:PhnB protein
MTTDSGSVPATSQITITPMLSFKDAASAIEFYKRAFGAVEVTRLTEENGRVGHAELRIGDAALMLSDEYPEIQVLSPETIGGSPVMLLLTVKDVDAVFHQAVAAGAAVDRPLQDTFGGAMRNGKLVDPFGHRWMILTRRADTPA